MNYQFELVGKDRYFKYRFAQEILLNFTTVEESWVMENQVLRYNVMADYLKRSLNIKVDYEGHKVSFLDLNDVLTGVFNNSHVIIIPAPLSIFDGLQEQFTPSPVFEMARTLILSGTPKRVLSTSLSFLNMDTDVVILMGLTLVLLSLLLVFHSIVTNKYKSLPIKKVVKKLAQETLENVWENASLLCAEPIPSILPHITCRLLASSWLLGVTFILFFLGCFLRTEFTTENYHLIDTLSDLIKSGVSPTMVKEAGTLEFLKYLVEWPYGVKLLYISGLIYAYLKATREPVVKEWLDALDKNNIFTNGADYALVIDGYTPILAGEKALIISDTYLTWFLGELLKTDFESKELLADEKGLYVSQHDVGFESLHFLFNTSFIRSSPIVHESVQLIMRPYFETQALKYLDFKMHHLIDQVTWKRPMKSVTDLDLSSVFVPFYLLFLLMSGAVAAVITEIFLNAV